jgi:hypothetical protein
MRKTAVSPEWVTKKLQEALPKASPERLAKFEGRLTPNKKESRMDKRASIGGELVSEVVVPTAIGAGAGALWNKYVEDDDPVQGALMGAGLANVLTAYSQFKGLRNLEKSLDNVKFKRPPPGDVGFLHGAIPANMEPVQKTLGPAMDFPKRASMHDLVNPVLEKRARIFGASEPDEITESAIPYERRLESYKNYLAEKSQEEPTSYPRAMLTGAAIGAIPAIPLAISSAPGIRRAVPALIGASLGALGGALMSKADRGHIDWAKKVVDAGDQEYEMIDAIRMASLQERLRREEEHQELLDRLDDLRNS